MEFERFTFVAAVNNMEVLDKNLCLSHAINSNDANQFIIKRNYSTASLAYNEAINEAINEIIIFVHQDIFFPESWLASLKQSLSHLDKENTKWGVIGCFGSKKGGKGGIGQVYTTGMGVHGRNIDKPEPVETLDEIVLVIRKSSGLRFDPSMPHFHLYGTDICMSSREKGMSCYAIPAFCVHNTNQILNYPNEFYECYHYIKRKWKKYLPIYTSCITISSFDYDLYLRRIREVYKRPHRKAIMPAHRAEDPRTLINYLLSAKQQNE